MGYPRNRFILYKRKIILYAFFSPLYLNLIGQIALSELFAIIDLFSTNLFRLFKIFSTLHNICLAYFIFFISQVVSDFINQSEFNNQVRGWANIVMAIIVVVYLVKYLSRSAIMIIYFLFAQAIGILIFRFSNSTFNLNEGGSFKFYIAPILNNIVLILVWRLIKGNKYDDIHILLIFIGYGLFCVLFDYRSNGLFMILTGFLYYKRRLFLYLTFNKFLKFLILFAVFIQILYSIFVFQVLSGNVVNDRTKQQLDRLDNPYNPFYLLATGRAETFVAIEAIKERPFFGHGSWAPDPRGKYNYMLALAHKEEDKFETTYDPSEKGYIPSHSVILGAWMTSGIIGFIAVCYIMISFLRSSLNILKKASTFTLPYLPIVLFFMLIGVWTFLFSPLPHIRQTLPSMLAFVIVLSKNKLN